MPYRYSKAEIGVAYDSTLSYPITGPLKFYADQTKDLQSAEAFVRIAPGASEAQVSIAPVTNGYWICVLSDYPVLVRLNGVSATQYTMRGNNVAATNVGAPLPDQCVFLATIAVTSVYLAPISGAVQTANCKVIVTGDPLNPYT